MKFIPQVSITDTQKSDNTNNSTKSPATKPVAKSPITKPVAKSPITKPIVILVTPEHGGNIGATMRAMANFGLEELRLVKPKEHWFNFDCLRFSMGAIEHLKAIKMYDTCYEALQDIHTAYALTVRHRSDMIKKTLTPSQAMQNAACFTHKWAFVFGNEVNGLDNQSVSMCNEIITIPAHDKFSSINLSQAVIICCYAWHTVAGNSVMKNVMINPIPAKADMKKIHYLLRRIYDHLHNNPSLTRTDNSLEITMQNVQNMIMRLQPTNQEVALFYRITDLAKSKTTDTASPNTETAGNTIKSKATDTASPNTETAGNTIKSKATDTDTTGKIKKSKNK